MVFGFLRRAAVAIAVSAGAPAVLLSGALLATSPASAAPLSSIQVNGNLRIDTATIRSYVTVDFGEEYGQSDLNDTLIVLFTTGFFADVDVTGTSGTIYVVVVENPVVVQISFDGNRRVRDDALVDLVQTQVRGVVNEAILAADVRRIEDHYARQGRETVIVDAEVQHLEGGLANLVFHIIEGDRVKIAEITFEGNQAYSDRQLESVIQTRESGLLTWIKKTDTYDPDRLALDRDLLRRHYLENGHADFQILDVNVVYDEESLRYSVAFIVSEGPLYEFGAIGVDSTIPGVTPESLARSIHTRSGAVFNAIELERSLEDISFALADAGLPFAQVTARANRDYVSNSISITYAIDPGPRRYIERITIIGNTRTRDYVVRRAFEDMAEGDAYNRVLVERVERRLMSLGIFAGVNIQVQRGSAPDQLVLLVYVEETRTGEVNFVAGYSTADGIIGEIALNENNFLGRGQQLRLALTIGKSNRNYSITFNEPQFLGRRMLFGFDVYRRVSSATTIRPFEEMKTGGQVRIGVPLTDQVNAQLSYSYVTEVISESTHTVYLDGTTVTSTLGLDFVVNTIDNMGDPRRGVFVRGGVDYAGLGGTNSFVRSTIDARIYQPLTREQQIVAMLRVRAGNITGIGGPVRVLDNFLLGDVRGFGYAGFGPRETAAPAQALGGRNYWTATAELQFPVPFVSEDAGFRAALFADAGMLWDVDGPLAVAFDDDMTLAASVGASLLWASPIGPLRIDYAFVLSSATYDVLQAFKFGVGAQF